MSSLDNYDVGDRLPFQVPFNRRRGNNKRSDVGWMLSGSVFSRVLFAFCVRVHFHHHGVELPAALLPSSGNSTFVKLRVVGRVSPQPGLKLGALTTLGPKAAAPFESLSLN